MCSSDLFFRGIPAEILAEVIAPLREGGTPTLRSLGLELAPLNLVGARDRGLDASWAEKLVKVDPMRRQVLSVVRRQAGTPAWDRLREGDLVLAVDGEPVVKFWDLEKHAAKPAVKLTILRDGAVTDVELPTVAVGSDGVDRVVQWAGAVLHAPHSPLATDMGLAPTGVYVSWTWSGTPAQRYGLRPTYRILAVDGVPTPDLDALQKAVAGRTDRGSVRLKVVDLDGKTQVITLKLDLQYWPTMELRSTPQGWVRTGG